MKIQIIVAAHKAYRMPTDPMYLPLHVGKAGKDLELGFQGDNTGENISEKNATYCELTGLYWAWKNLNADYIGLAHYRRHFRGKSGKDKWDCILTTVQAEQLLQNYDVLVPKRRNYYIETAYNQYVHAHPAEPLDLMISLASAQGENYRAAAEAMRHRTWTHIYNMFIMKRELFDQMGIRRSQVKLNDLILLEEETSPASKKFNKSGAGKIKMSKSSSVSTEINLIGKTTDEAIALLDKYLDDAYLAHLPSVRIVHGKGTGALRGAVQSHLKRCKYVKSYHLGEFGEGDAGVTIAEFES